MNRRSFLTALLGAAAATAFLPAGSIASPVADGGELGVTVVDPTWLQQAQALKVGDVFTISGVTALNPTTGKDTLMLQRFVIAHVCDTHEKVTIWPTMITTGPYANCSGMPADDAELALSWNLVH